MSYTTIELVKKHVIAPALEPLSSVTLTVEPTGSAWSTLSRGAVQQGSVRVTSETQNIPVSEPLTFSSSKANSSLFPIAQGSVTLASDSSLGTQYVENVDFTVDYQTGAMESISGGALSSSATTHLWYFPLTPYTEGVDYEIDYANAKLRRLTAGAIVNGQSLQVSFMPVTQALDDSVYTEAVSEANQRVSAAVDPNEDFGADLNLQTAATYLAASVVCRVVGTLALSTTADPKSASMWLELTESFRRDGSTALDRFRPPHKRLNGPQSV